MAFAFTACKKNSDGKVVIMASMPETTSNSKTYLDNDWVNWSNFDEMLVCDLQSTEGEDHVWLEVEGGQHTKTAIFYGKPDFFAHLEMDDKSYTAFYPIVSDTLFGDDSVTLVIPKVQSFEKNSFATNTYPMYAFNKANYLCNCKKHC